MRVISEEEYNIIIGKMQEIDVTLHLVLNEQVATQQDLEARVLTFYSKLDTIYSSESRTMQEQAVLDLVRKEFIEIFGITTKRYGESS